MTLRATCPVLLLALLSCAPPAPAPEYLLFDLVESLPYAETTASAGCLLPASPLARPQLLSGWSAAEQDRDRGESFVWSLGPKSRMELASAGSNATSLHFRVRPFRYPEAPSQTITPVINGKAMDEITLEEGLQDYSTPIPSSVLHPGTNRLDLRYRHHRSPREVLGTPDDRQLAVAWYRICLGDGESESESPERHGSDPTLYLPFGSRIDYFLRLEKDSYLAIDQVQSRGQGRLMVEIEVDGIGIRDLDPIIPKNTATRLNLSMERSDIVRLGLRAKANDDDPEARGLLLRLPRIMTAGLDPRQPAERSTQRSIRSRPNIVIYLIDTLRADQIGAYGQERPLTPAIDAFSGDAIVFDNALAQSSWTRSTVASILTGLWPLEHGTHGRRDRLAEAAITLPEILSSEGYETAALFTNPNLDRQFGFDQGWATFIREIDSARSESITEGAIRWLAKRESGRPFLLYLHTQDPHDPYNPPSDLRERLAPDVPLDFPTVPGRKQKITKELVENFQELYQSEVAANDRSFGALIEHLRSEGLYDDSVILLLSDHGEEFQEHGGWKHGRTLHREMVSVPVILKLPGLRDAGERRQDPIQHIDLLPTLLGEVGLQIPEDLAGRNLLEMNPAQRPRESALFSYLHLDGAPQISVLEGGWKLIHILAGEKTARPRLYSQELDPDEKQNLSEDYPVMTSYLMTLAREHLATARRLETREAEIDEDLEESLRALGYF